MPRASVDVFLDGTLQGTMKDARNVLTIDNAGVALLGAAALMRRHRVRV